MRHDKLSNDPAPPAARDAAGPRPTRLARAWPWALAILVLSTCWAVAMISVWLVVPYLGLMVLLLAPSGPRGASTDRDGGRQAPDRTAPRERTATEPPRNGQPGADVDGDSTGDADADTQAATGPEAGPETLDSSPTRSKRGKGRGRKARTAPPAEPVEASWVQVAPGKFVRVEGPAADAVPPPTQEPGAGPGPNDDDGPHKGPELVTAAPDVTPGLTASVTFSDTPWNRPDWSGSTEPAYFGEHAADPGQPAGPSPATGARAEAAEANAVGSEAEAGAIEAGLAVVAGPETPPEPDAEAADARSEPDEDPEPTCEGRALDAPDPAAEGTADLDRTEQAEERDDAEQGPSSEDAATAVEHAEGASDVPEAGLEAGDPTEPGAIDADRWPRTEPEFEGAIARDPAPDQDTDATADEAGAVGVEDGPDRDGEAEARAEDDQGTPADEAGPLADPDGPDVARQGGPPLDFGADAEADAHAGAWTVADGPEDDGPDGVVAEETGLAYGPGSEPDPATAQADADEGWIGDETAAETATGPVEGTGPRGDACGEPTAGDDDRREAEPDRADAFEREYADPTGLADEPRADPADQTDRAWGDNGNAPDAPDDAGAAEVDGIEAGFAAEAVSERPIPPEAEAGPPPVPRPIAALARSSTAPPFPPAGAPPRRNLRSSRRDRLPAGFRRRSRRGSGRPRKVTRWSPSRSPPLPRGAHQGRAR